MEMSIGGNLRSAVYLAAGLGIGGVSGYLLARHVHRARADREIAEVTEHFRARAADPQSSQTTLDVLPTVVRNDYGGEVLLGVHDGYRAPHESAQYRELLGITELNSGEPNQEAAEDPDRSPISYRVPDADAIDPRLGLDDEDYDRGRSQSLGVDRNGDEVEDPDDLYVDPEGYESEDEDDSSEPDPRGPGPYIITEQEFSEQRLTYQKLTVTYYSGDRVLCDDKDAPIRDINNTVGPDAVGKLGLKDDKDPIVYIRNDRLNVDFELCVNYGSFVEIVLGHGTANPKPRHILPGGV